MRIVVHGQQAFGKAVLEKLLERGENVVGVFCAPDKEGRPRDPLAEFAEEKGLPLHQPTSWKTPEALELMQSFEPDVCIMAFVTLFVPQPVIDAPRLGTFQYHPSLLPLHRGPSSINWPIIQGATRTGLSIFWPDEGLDEGPILMQKEVEIGPDDTLGSIYFKKLFPMGVDALIESLDLVRDGKASRVDQDHTRATYESWAGKKAGAVDWSLPAAAVHNRIRGCDPSPGAWTMSGDTEIALFDSTRGGASEGDPGTVVAIDDAGMTVVCGDKGTVILGRIRPKGGAKETAVQAAGKVGLEKGARLGSAQ
ncbi:MAG: methionyl-tRNA formyltransferase [Geminicoccaceae bacterium]|nr:methionyl-tRNA formyltransferase [Geminicoccaceae bacterium]